MTTRLCPVSFVELRVGWSEALVWCPRCAIHHDREFLRERDDTPCRCGHRRSSHGRYFGRAYTCPLSTCVCNEPKPKEKPMATTETHMTDTKTVSIIREFAETIQRLERAGVAIESMAWRLGIDVSKLQQIEYAVRCDCGKPETHVFN